MTPCTLQTGACIAEDTPESTLRTKEEYFPLKVMTSVYQITRRQKPEGSNLQTHGYDSLKIHTRKYLA